MLVNIEDHILTDQEFKLVHFVDFHGICCCSIGVSYQCKILLLFCGCGFEFSIDIIGISYSS